MYYSLQISYVNINYILWQHTWFHHRNLALDNKKAICSVGCCDLCISYGWIYLHILNTQQSQQSSLHQLSLSDVNFLPNLENVS